MLNNYLYDLCDGLKNVKLMENIAITDKMLRDRKHLNNEVFKKLLANIRYNLFGKIPTFRPKKTAKSLNYNQQFNRNGYDSRSSRGDFYNSPRSIVNCYSLHLVVSHLPSRYIA